MRYHPGTIEEYYIIQLEEGMGWVDFSYRYSLKQQKEAIEALTTLVTSHRRQRRYRFRLIKRTVREEELEP